MSKAPEEAPQGTTRGLPRKLGQEYVTRGGAVYGWSKSRIAIRCAAEVEVSVRIARMVLFEAAPITSNARRRARTWGVKNGIKFLDVRKPPRVDYATQALAQAEREGGERRAAWDAMPAPEQDPPSAPEPDEKPRKRQREAVSEFERLLREMEEHVASAERAPRPAEKGHVDLAREVIRGQLEAKAAALEGKREDPDDDAG